MQAQNSHHEQGVYRLCGSVEPSRLMGLQCATSILCCHVGGDGNVLKANEEGEVAINCSPHPPPGLFSRYVNDEERTAKCFHNNYYLTGDKGNSIAAHSLCPKYCV